MRKLILIFTLAFTTISYGQMRNGQGQRQMRQPQQEAPKPKFEVEKYVGVIIYDIKKAAKKSSVKLSSKEGVTFSKILTMHNKDINDIKRINSFLLRSTKEMVESYQKQAMKTGDISNQQKVMKTMNENLKPIAETIKKEDKKLDKAMKTLLSKKQYKKWIKYNRKMYKVFPKE